MAFLIDQNGDIDAVQTVFLFKLLHFDVHRIRQFLAQIAEQFFTHDFHRQKTRRFVRNHIFGIHRHAFGQIRLNQLQQVGNPQSVFRADRLRRRKFKFGAHLGNKRLQRVTVFRLVLVDFVDH
ncbi:Uncharacterised protein [Neisseria meningitidis]|nr:Uncharacterised protein [Neisseria meningitidis]CWR67667.1 Uncharacterised protein [Neisseria meningitidis]